MLTAIDTSRQQEAMMVVRWRYFTLRCSRPTFQVPAFENQYGTTEGHGRVEHRIQRILQNQLCARSMAVSHSANHIERRKIGNDVSGTDRQPPCEPVGHPGEPTKV